MSAKFSVGEIAILIKSTIPGDADVGKECEILALPKPAEWVFLPHGMACAHRYVIRAQSGVWCCQEEFLRKRRPPEQPCEDDFFTDFKNMIGIRKPEKAHG